MCDLHCRPNLPLSRQRPRATSSQKRLRWISRSPKDSQGEILAVKIVRQVKSIALLGAPTSAAGLASGQEGAPAALRSAGLLDRLTSAGFQVTDYGDCAPRGYQAEDEPPKDRHATEELAILG